MFFPRFATNRQHVADVLRKEEEAFNKTLDRGIEEFNLALKVAAPAKGSLLGIIRSPKRSSPATLLLSFTTPTAFRST